MQYADMEGQSLRSEHFHQRIHCRSGHVAVQYKGHMLVWAGFMEQPGGFQSSYHNTDELIIYNSFTEVWSRILTSGDIPCRNSGACGVILDDKLYIYGGFREVTEDRYENNTSRLYCLDLRTRIWRRLNPEGVAWPLAVDKLVGWTFRGKLYFFGGFGPAPENPLEVSFQHVPSIDDIRMRGWNNQLLCYDPDTNEWSRPSTRGPTPSPRAAHAGDITGNTFYLFGGRLQDVRMNSLHRLNMDTMEWSPDLTNNELDAPEGRSWHSFTFINESTAILYGGFSQQSMILSDSWQLTLPDLKWQPLSGSHHTSEPRLWHQALYLAPARTLVICGGHRTSIFQTTPNREHADALLKLNFEPKSLLRLCLNCAVENFQQTSPEWHTLPDMLHTILKCRLEQRV